MTKFFFGAVLSLFLTACSGGTGVGGTDGSLTRVTQSRTIRAAYINYPPSFIVDPNTKAKSGIMSDVMMSAAKSMEIKLDYSEETGWATMIDLLNSGKVDVVVSGIWPSSARALKADFSKVVYYSPVYAYARSGNTRFDGGLTKANAAAVKVAAIDGELSSIVAKSDYPQAAVVSLPQQTDVSQLLLQISSGKADITFVEAAIADEFLAKNPGAVRRVANVDPVRLFPNTFLFAKGQTGLRDAINIAIIELQNSGEVARIVKKYDANGTHFILPATPLGP